MITHSEAFSLRTHGSAAPGTGSGSWLFGDFSGDGRTDAVLVEAREPRMYQWRSMPYGAFRPSTRTLLPGTNRGIWRSADIDIDGRTDLVRINDGQFHTWLARGGPSDAATRFDVTTSSSPAPRTVGAWLVLDLNGDGRSDLAHIVPGGPSISTFIAGSDGAFTAGSTPVPPGAVAAGPWLVADVDGDGYDDIVKVAAGATTLETWLWRNGRLEVRRQAARPEFFGPGVVWRVGDFNGDGLDDLVNLAPRTHYATLWRSTGDGAYDVVRSTAFPGYVIPNGDWIVADLNADGRDDMVHAVVNGTFVHTWIAGHGGLFTVSDRLPLDSSTPNNDGAPWVAGSLDLDGRADLMRGLGPQLRLETLRTLLPAREPVPGRDFRDAVAALRIILNRLSPDEQLRLRCRLATLAEAERPAREAAFAAIQATQAEMAQIEARIADLRALSCSHVRDVSNGVASAFSAIDAVASPALARFSRGSLLAGDTLGQLAIGEAMQRYQDLCHEATTGGRLDLEALARMPEATFGVRTTSLALGICSGQQGRQISLRGGSAYGQCVQGALWEAASKSLESCGLAGLCGLNELTSCSSDTLQAMHEDATWGAFDARRRHDCNPNDAEAREAHARASAELAAIEQAQRSQNTATLGSIAAGAGVALMASMLVVALVGGCVATAGLACGVIVGIGVGSLAAGGVAYTRADSQSARSESAWQRARDIRLCPAIAVAQGGPLTFAASSSAGGEPRGADRMTVLDAVQACACETGAVVAIPGDAAGGGNRCEYGARLACLREATVADTGRPMSVECRRLLAGDNAPAPLRACGVINCGPDMSLDGDCRCTPTDQTAHVDPSSFGGCQIQCAAGHRPTARGCGCELEGPLIPDLGLPPVPDPFPPFLITPHAR